MKNNSNCILIVDPDQNSLLELARGLRDAGYQVLEAATLAGAIEHSRQQQPELAVLDVQLPDATVSETVRQLRQCGQNAFLFVSTGADRNIARQAVAEGALGYLIKPLEAELLVPSIKAALERVRELRRLRETESQLNKTLEQSRQISVAIGLIMERHRLGEKAAFETLRTFARSQRRKLAEVAREVVQSTEVMNRLHP